MTCDNCSPVTIPFSDLKTFYFQHLKRMAWNRYLTMAFEDIDSKSRADECLGPWNQLLNTLFPPNTRFTVRPQYLRQPTDLETLFLVSHEHSERPVLIVELMWPSVLCSPFTRFEADIRMRDRIRGYKGQYISLNLCCDSPFTRV